MSEDTSGRSVDGSDRLPTPCPQCGTTLETRGDAMVHMLSHVGDGDTSGTAIDDDLRTDGGRDEGDDE